MVGKTIKANIEVHQVRMADLNLVLQAGTRMYNVLPQDLLECRKDQDQMLLHNGLIKADTPLINSRLINISR